MPKRNITKTEPVRLPSWSRPKQKACAYVRVSTGHEKQLDSLENQRQYYERTIRANPEYEFAGIFVDAGISGAKEDRPGFARMMEEARSGHINLIFTKSISRFARNTVFLLATVRELRGLGVAVIFEEQHINTLSSDGELMLTVLASIAEEERKAVRGNVQWAVRGRYSRGECAVDANRLLGYTKDADGNLVVEEAQARIVRTIFRKYVSGQSGCRIARELNNGNVPADTGHPWSSCRILRIISNEKYAGDCLLQKTYVDESGKQVPNRGQCGKYLIRNHHPPVIGKKMWEKAQRIRSAKAPRTYPYSHRIHCPVCGAALIRVTSRWGVDWVCGTYMGKGKDACPGIRVPEETLIRIAQQTEGHYTIEEIQNEEKDKRKKNYRLTPARERRPGGGSEG